METPQTSQNFSLTSTNSEGDASHARFSEYKAKGKSDQQRRREDYLSKQKQKRRDLTQHARQLVQSEETENVPEKEDSSMEIVKTKKKSLPNVRYQNQLMIPETLQDIPLDLQTSWCVVPYPSNAQRCLLISAGGASLLMITQGKTTSRLEDGSVLHRFSSGLPNGSRGKREGSSDSWSIFDCFFHPDSSTYFVLDMMSWKGHSYYDCSTDFRLVFVFTSPLGSSFAIKSLQKRKQEK